jgi:hypothetical protein
MTRPEEAPKSTAARLRVGDTVSSFLVMGAFPQFTLIFQFVKKSFKIWHYNSG